MENKQKIIDIINNYNPETASEKILQLFGDKSMKKCIFCGSDNITIESDGIWCNDCSQWNSTKQ